MLDTLKLGFIGGGNMAAALIGGLIAKGAHGANIVVVDPTEPARARAEQSWGAHAAAAPGTELADRDVIVLAVKPQQMRDVCAQLAPHLGDSLVLSVAAGIRIQDLSRWLNGHARIVRAMPNTPALSGLGMTGLAANAGLSEADRATASAIANAVGKSLWVPAEAQIDAVVRAVAAHGLMDRPLEVVRVEHVVGSAVRQRIETKNSDRERIRIRNDRVRNLHAPIEVRPFLDDTERIVDARGHGIAGLVANHRLAEVPHAFERRRHRRTDVLIVVVTKLVIRREEEQFVADQWAAVRPAEIVDAELGLVDP
jgi:threonine dehydrogenase-like Zn-dependent dehydrogenase